MKFKVKTLLAAMVAVQTAALLAEGGSEADKPEGFRFFNNHLVVKPYVSFAYMYDSNVDSTHHASDDSIFLVSPAMDFVWRGESWKSLTEGFEKDILSQALKANGGNVAATARALTTTPRIVAYKARKYGLSKS